jgi:hypothetical protein
MNYFSSMFPTSGNPILKNNTKKNSNTSGNNINRNSSKTSKQTNNEKNLKQLVVSNSSGKNTKKNSNKNSKQTNNEKNLKQLVVSNTSGNNTNENNNSRKYFESTSNQIHYNMARNEEKRIKKQKEDYAKSSRLGKIKKNAYTIYKKIPTVFGTSEQKKYSNEYRRRFKEEVNKRTLEQEQRAHEIRIERLRRGINNGHTNNWRDNVWAR